MGYSTNGKNVMLDQLGTVAGFASLHSAFPGNTGASEITGGSPAYARKAITWNAAGGGTKSNATNPTFDVAGALTIAWLGLWSLVTAGVFYGAFPLGSGPTQPVESDAVADTLTAENHALVNGTKVVILHTGAFAIPGGLTEGTVYFVVGSTTDTFQLSLTSGGSAIDITTDTVALVCTIIPETFGAQGVFTTTSVQLDLVLA